jgi:O-antigen/teichoic acid export membrane protein
MGMERELTESPARSVFRHSVMTFGTRVGIVLVNIPTSILVARLLGTEGQGSYASAIIFPTMFAFIGLLGIDAAHTYLLSGKRAPLGQINAQSLRLAVVLSFVITPLYLLFVRLYRGAEDPEVASILSMAAAVVPILLAKYLSVALLLGLQRIKWFNLANAVQALVLLGLMCANLFAFRGGVRGAVVAYMVSEVSVTAIAIAVARREARGRPLFDAPRPGLLRRSLVYGLQGHVGNVLTQFTYRFDMFLVLSMVGLAGQGLYSIAVILAEKLSHIPQSVQVVLFPKLSSLPTEEANRLTPRVLRSSLFLTAIAGVVLLLLSRPLLLLFYGTAYLPGLRALRILVPGIVMLSIAKILAGDFSSRDRRTYHTIATAIGFGVNLALCLVWIPRMGIEGAAWASTVAYALQSVVVLVFFRKLSGNGILESTIVRGDDLRLYWEQIRSRLSR